jgi:hypothetical protein
MLSIKKNFLVQFPIKFIEQNDILIRSNTDRIRFALRNISNRLPQNVSWTIDSPTEEFQIISKTGAEQIEQASQSEINVRVQARKLFPYQAIHLKLTLSWFGNFFNSLILLKFMPSLDLDAAAASDVLLLTDEATDRESLVASQSALFPLALPHYIFHLDENTGQHNVLSRFRGKIVMVFAKPQTFCRYVPAASIVQLFEPEQGSDVRGDSGLMLCGYSQNDAKVFIDHLHSALPLVAHIPHEQYSEWYIVGRPNAEYAKKKRDAIVRQHLGSKLYSVSVRMINDVPRGELLRTSLAQSLYSYGSFDIVRSFHRTDRLLAIPPEFVQSKSNWILAIIAAMPLAFKLKAMMLSNKESNINCLKENQFIESTLRAMIKCNIYFELKDAYKLSVFPQWNLEGLEAKQAQLLYYCLKRLLNAEWSNPFDWTNYRKMEAFAATLQERYSRVLGEKFQTDLKKKITDKERVKWRQVFDTSHYLLHKQ